MAPYTKSYPLKPIGWAYQTHVSFVGRIPWNCVQEFLASADIFVLPSIRDKNGAMDGLPTVLLEAMSCGTPVLLPVILAG